ncbi:unnamed protein product, partial [Meganyctiphanes norvegica]
MGVKDLWGLVSPIGEVLPLTALQGTTVSIDLAPWVVDSQNVNMGRVTRPHLRNLLWRTLRLLDAGVLPIFVLEGDAPSLKWNTISKRNQQNFGCGREAAAVTVKTGKRSQFKNVQKECGHLLDLLGVPWVQATGEAEATCAALNYHKVVSGVITQDSDVFLYGGETVLRNFTANQNKATVEKFCMPGIEEHLGVNRSGLLVLSLLLGCDYLPGGIPQVGKETAIRMIREWHQQGVTDPLGRICKWSLEDEDDWKDINPKKWKNGSLLELEAGVRRRALATEGFPFLEIIKEYKTKLRLPISSYKWRQPQMKELMRWCIIKLDWEPDYALEKIAPVVSRWIMMNISPQKPQPSNYVPEMQAVRCVKKCVRGGVASMVVEWRVVENEKFECIIPANVNTDEPVVFIRESVPQLIEQFESQLKAKKKGKSSRKKKSEELKTKKKLSTKENHRTKANIKNKEYSSSQIEENMSDKELSIIEPYDMQSLNDEDLAELSGMLQCESLSNKHYNTDSITRNHESSNNDKDFNESMTNSKSQIQPKVEKNHNNNNNDIVHKGNKIESFIEKGIPKYIKIEKNMKPTLLHISNKSVCRTATDQENCMKDENDLSLETNKNISLDDINGTNLSSDQLSYEEESWQEDENDLDLSMIINRITGMKLEKNDKYCEDKSSKINNPTKSFIRSKNDKTKTKIIADENLKINLESLKIQKDREYDPKNSICWKYFTPISERQDGSKTPPHDKILSSLARNKSPLVNYTDNSLCSNIISCNKRKTDILKERNKSSLENVIEPLKQQVNVENMASDIIRCSLKNSSELSTFGNTLSDSILAAAAEYISEMIKQTTKYSPNSSNNGTTPNLPKHHSTPSVGCIAPRRILNRRSHGNTPNLTSFVSDFGSPFSMLSPSNDVVSASSSCNNKGCDTPVSSKITLDQISNHATRKTSESKTKSDLSVSSDNDIQGKNSEIGTMEYQCKSYETHKYKVQEDQLCFDLLDTFNSSNTCGNVSLSNAEEKRKPLKGLKDTEHNVNMLTSKVKRVKDSISVDAEKINLLKKESTKNKFIKSKSSYIIQDSEFNFNKNKKDKESIVNNKIAFDKNYIAEEEEKKSFSIYSEVSTFSPVVPSQYVSLADRLKAKYRDKAMGNLIDQL